MSELLPKYKLPHSKLFDARGNIPENSHNCKFHYVFQTYCLGLRNAVKSTGTNFGTFRSYSLSQILFLEIGNHPQRKVSWKEFFKAFLVKVSPKKILSKNHRLILCLGLSSTRTWNTLGNVKSSIGKVKVTQW